MDFRTSWSGRRNNRHSETPRRWISNFDPIFAFPSLGIHFAAVEGLACYNEVIGYASDKCILTGRCNYAGQAVNEEPDQGFPTSPFSSQQTTMWKRERKANAWCHPVDRLFYHINSSQGSMYYFKGRKLVVSPQVPHHSCRHNPTHNE